MGLQVTDKCCGQCLFSKNKIVSDKRKAQILKKTAQDQSYFVCHKATIEGKDICCRGFYEKHGHVSQMVRIAERLNMVEFVPVEESC